MGKVFEIVSHALHKRLDLEKLKWCGDNIPQSEKVGEVYLRSWWGLVAGTEGHFFSIWLEIGDFTVTAAQSLIAAFLLDCSSVRLNAVPPSIVSTPTAERLPSQRHSSLHTQQFLPPSSQRRLLVYSSLFSQHRHLFTVRYTQ
ncbi:unnamed protein product [Ilex paraguariensis]|uniref:Uncharacterized protein n=1 Tax=Ilex paraguariensis TaxID=185542 RepID=A0ABC8QRH7_9AQUA